MVAGIFNVFYVCSLQVPSQHQIKLRSELQIFCNKCFFNNSFLIHWCGLLLHHMVRFWQSFSCWLEYLDEFMVDEMTASCLGSMAVSQAQIITPPPLYLTVGMKCFVFARCSDLQYGQTSSLQSCVSTGHCCKSCVAS